MNNKPTYTAQAIQQAFAKRKAFIPFLTAGDPHLEATGAFIKTMAAAGADLIEIGIPFSDPVAEGPVIQAASLRALQAGTTTDKIFDMVDSIRPEVEVPLVFMTYINPIYVYGKEKFVARCAQSGISGLIVPDLPFEEKGELAEICRQHRVALISLIAPTSENRIQAIAQDAEGFIYCVSSLGVTGVRQEIQTDLQTLVNRIKSTTTLPVAIGFGIATPEQAQAMGKLADGAIVGSAIVKLIAQHGNQAAPILQDYVSQMRKALDEL